MDSVTRRLHIRDLRDSDVNAMIETWTDPDVAHFMGDFGPRTPAAVRDWLEETIRGQATRARTSHNCAIELKDCGVVVGWIGFGPSSKPVAPYDFGYALAPAHRGHSYMAEALTAVLHFCFTELRTDAVWGECDVANLASARVMTAAGMSPTAPSDEGDPRFIAHAHSWPRSSDPRAG